MVMTLGKPAYIRKRPKRSVVKFEHKIYSRACPRCSGDVGFDYDIYSKANVLDCVQCGWIFIGETLWQ